MNYRDMSRAQLEEVVLQYQRALEWYAHSETYDADGVPGEFDGLHFAADVGTRAKDILDRYPIDDVQTDVYEKGNSWSTTLIEKWQVVDRAGSIFTRGHDRETVMEAVLIQDHVNHGPMTLHCVNIVETRRVEPFPFNAEQTLAVLRVARDLHNSMYRVVAASGDVCEEYELCRHKACAASGAAWEIADKAIKRFGKARFR